MAFAVGHAELWHRFANGGYFLFGSISSDALDELIVGRLKFGQQLARFGEI